MNIAYSTNFYILTINENTLILALIRMLFLINFNNYLPVFVLVIISQFSPFISVKKMRTKNFTEKLSALKIFYWKNFSEAVKFV